METNARIQRPAMVRNTRKRPCEIVWWLIKRTNDCVQKMPQKHGSFLIHMSYLHILSTFIFSLSLLLSLSHAAV